MPPPIEIVQKVLRHRTVNINSEFRKKRSNTNYQKVAKSTLKKRRISIFSSSVPAAVNGCRKLRTRLVKIASDDDKKPVLKKRKISPRTISPNNHSNSKTYLTLRSKALPQREELYETADSIISTSVIVQVPHITNTDAAPLPSQPTATTEKQQFSVIVYSTKAARSADVPSSLDLLRLTETSKVNSTDSAVEEVLVPLPCSAAIVRKTDCAKQTSVIHWIDKDVSLLQNPPNTERSHRSLSTSTAVASTINSVSDQNLRFMVLVRTIQRSHIELPYPRIDDIGNWFRPFASLFQMLRINNDSSNCVKSIQGLLENGEKPLKSASEKEEETRDPTINCTIEWNKSIDKTLIRCMDEGLNDSPVHLQQYSTTIVSAAADNKGEMDAVNRDDNEYCNKSAFKTQKKAAYIKQSIPSSPTTLQNFTLKNSIKDPSYVRKTNFTISFKNINNKKFVKIPTCTLRDRVQTKYDFIPINSILTDSKRHPTQESLLIKLEVQPNLSNVNHPVNLKNYRKPTLTNNHLNLSSSIGMNKVKSQITQINTTNRRCKACGQPNLVEMVPPYLASTEKCSECNLKNSEAQLFPIGKDGSLDISEEEDSDNAVTILPATPIKRYHVLPEPSMEKTLKDRSILSMPSLMTSCMKLPLKSKIFPENQTEYTKYFVKNPSDFRRQRNLILPRVQCPATVVFDRNSLLKSTQSCSAVVGNEIGVKNPDNASPKSSADLFRGFSPVSHVWDDPRSDEDIDVGSDSVSYCTTPNISGERIVEPNYHRQLNYKKPLITPPNPQNTMKRKFEHNRFSVVPLPPMSMYALQLHHHYRQTRETDTAGPPKIRALQHEKKPNDSTLLGRKENTSLEICFDKDFLAEPSRSTSTLMSLPIYDFFADEDITLEDILTKYL